MYSYQIHIKWVSSINIYFSLGEDLIKTLRPCGERPISGLLARFPSFYVLMTFFWVLFNSWILQFCFVLFFFPRMLLSWLRALFTVYTKVFSSSHVKCPWQGPHVSILCFLPQYTPSRYRAKCRLPPVIQQIAALTLGLSCSLSHFYTPVWNFLAYCNAYSTFYFSFS